MDTDTSGDKLELQAGTQGEQYNMRRQCNPGNRRMPRTHTLSRQIAGRATHLTEREKSPWFLRLGRARKLPGTPRPLSRVSASGPLRSR